MSSIKEVIENELFEQNYKVYGQKVDVVFYDVTTFAFESVIVDELRNFGFSKDCKFNEVQVVMGLLIDTNGLPIGYELFAGNTFDGKTLVKSLRVVFHAAGRYVSRLLTRNASTWRWRASNLLPNLETQRRMVHGDGAGWKLSVRHSYGFHFFFPFYTIIAPK